MPTLLTSGLVIDHLRFRVENERNLRKGLRNMTMKLTRLSDKAMKARSNIEALDQAYDAFNAKAGNHAAEVGELTEQIGEMQSDLNFSVGVMGNSVAASNGSSEPQPRPVVSQAVGTAVTQPEPPAIAPAPAPDAPATVGDPNKPVEHVATISDRISNSNWVPPR